MRNPTVITWLAVTVWWLLSGLVHTGQIVTMYDADGGGPPAMHVLRIQMISALLWIPLTMALLWCVRQAPIEHGRLRSALVLLGSAVVAVIVLRAAAVMLLNDIVGWYAQAPGWLAVLRASVLNNLLMSWLIVGVAHALLYAERGRRQERLTTELETRLAQARFDALSAQLDPHFLFNALNSIAELVHRDPNAADRMLVGLGMLLRHSLDGAHAQQVPLRDELGLVEHYIEIEKVRLGTRLRFRCEVEPELLPAHVPRLVLQPLVENAIRHAISQRTTPGWVSIRAHRQGPRLLLEVRDDGGPVQPSQGHGVGLSNTRARLQCLYGADHRFEVASQPSGGTLARLDIPLRLMAEAA